MRKTYVDPKSVTSVSHVTLGRIASHLSPYRHQVAIVFSCIALAAGLNLLAPWFVKKIVDQAIPSGNLTLLWLYCAGMLSGPVVAGFLQMAQKYYAEKIGQNVMFDMRVSLYRHLHGMPLAFFATQKPGQAVSHVLNDVQGVGAVVTGTMVDVVQNGIVLLSTTLFMFALDWRLALVAVCFLPLFVTPTRRVGQKRKILKRGVQAQTAELTGILTETLSVSGALLIKACGSEETETERFRRKADQIRSLSLQQTLVGRWFNLLLGLFEAVGPVIVFALGGWLVIKGEVATGTLVAFVALLKRLYGPASQLASVHVDLITSYAYFERVFELLDRVPSIQDGAITRRPGRIEGRLELKGLTFRYDDSHEALRSLDLTVRAGSTVAIVGPSGAGKSTIASMILRLYDATEGAVLLDGIDVRDLGVADVRANMAVVTQDTFLFHASVLDNLRYGRANATRAEAEEAARQAQIHHVIAALPDGYDTIVGERGYRFSAGERQRLAIARAILRDPRVLILDEATSSLDSASEQLVQTALVPLVKHRTTVIIAHRLPTIRDADLIVVLDKGRIVQRGTHEQLLSRPGLYARLWRTQMRDARQDTALEPVPMPVPAPIIQAPAWGEHFHRAAS